MAKWQSDLIFFQCLSWSLLFLQVLNLSQFLKGKIRIYCSKCYINYQSSVRASKPKNYWYFNTTRIYKQQQSNKSLGKKGKLCPVNYPLKNTLKRRITPCRFQCSVLSLGFLQGGHSNVPGSQVVGTSEKKLRESEQARTFSFPLFFIFFALSFLSSLSFSPRSVFFSLVPTNWEPAIMRALWGTLEEARALKLTWAPPVTLI